MTPATVIERTRVRISDTTTGPQARGSYELSRADLHAARPFGTVWLFRDDLNIPEFKESLSIALRKFPFLSGRIEQNRVHIDDRGVELVIQRRLDLNRRNIEPYLKKNPDEFLESDFAGKGVLEGECSVLTVVVTLLGCPETKDGCQGFLIGVSMLHTLGDAASFFKFIDFWSICRRPGADLNLVFRRAPSRSTRTRQEARRDLEASPNFHPRPDRVVQPNKTTHKMYYLHVPSETISHLKVRLGDKPSSSAFSTFTCLCAHFLPLIFEGFGMAEDNILKMIPLVVNVRDPASDGPFLFGNYFLIVNVAVCTDDSSSLLAAKFHEVIHQYSRSPDRAERIARHFSLLEDSLLHHPGRFASVVFENTPTYRSFLCNDFSRFGMQRAHFGTGLQPVMFLPFPPSHFSVLPAPDGDGRIVGLAGLNPHVVSYCEREQHCFLDSWPRYPTAS